MLSEKKVAIVGAGSLGSYVSEELVRSGVKNLVLIDSDGLEQANIMRNRLTYLYHGNYKVEALAAELQYIHPEVIVTPIKENITTANCLNIIPDDVDVVIFTVDSTDIQIECNRIFKACHYNKPVLFAWLEGDGKSSHVASIQYRKSGCYECLFTDKDGKHCLCRANVSNEEEPVILRNGCGGTRVAYGNSTLLSASKIVLEAMADCFNEQNAGKDNTLIGFHHGKVVRSQLSGNHLCGCCGMNN